MQPQTISQKTNTPQYILILATIFITIYLTTGIVQYRLITFGHIYFSSAIYIYPLSYLICDVVTEVYGYKICRQLIWCGIIAWLMAGIFIEFVTYLRPPSFWRSYAEQYDYIMGSYLRYAYSSAAGVLLGQFLNSYLISKLKIFVKGRYFWLRSVISTFVGDGITIFIALLFIYYGRMPISNVFEIIFYEIIINVIYCGVIAIPAVFLVRFLKRAEQLDTYDYNVNFNPFKLGLTS